MGHRTYLGAGVSTLDNGRAVGAQAPSGLLLVGTSRADLSRWCERVAREGRTVVACARLGGCRAPRTLRDGWHVSGQYGYELREVVTLTRPVAVKPKCYQGFWRIPRTELAWVQAALPALVPHSLAEQIRGDLVTGGV
jgi:hypothetical protein